MSVTREQSGPFDASAAENDEAPERRLLERISELAVRQCAAIVARDVPALNRLFESLLRLHGELGALRVQRPAQSEATSSSLRELRSRVREQLRLNQVLLANGTAITDQYMALLGASSTGASPAPNAAAGAALFSGVA
jgi:hypothetical protein